MPNNEIILPATKLATEADYYCCSWGTNVTRMQHNLLPAQFPVKKKIGAKYLTVTDTTTSFVGDFMCQWTTYLAALVWATAAALCATGVGAIIGAGIIGALVGGIGGAAAGGLLCGFFAASHRSWYLPADNVIVNGQKVVTQQSFMKCNLFQSQIQYMPNVKTFWDALLLTGSNAILVVLKCAMIGAGIGTIATFIISASTAGFGAAFAALAENAVLNFRAMWITGYGLGARGVLGLNQMAQDHYRNNYSRYSFLKGFAAVETAPVDLAEGTYKSAVQIVTKPSSIGNLLGNGLIVLTNIASVPAFGTPEIPIGKSKNNTPNLNKKIIKESNLHNQDTAEFNAPKETKSETENTAPVDIGTTPKIDPINDPSITPQQIVDGIHQEHGDNIQAEHDALLNLQRKIDNKLEQAPKYLATPEEVAAIKRLNDIYDISLERSNALGEKIEAAEAQQYNELKSQADKKATEKDLTDNSLTPEEIVQGVYEKHNNDIYAEHRALSNLTHQIYTLLSKTEESPSNQGIIQRLNSLLDLVYERMQKLQLEINRLEEQKFLQNIDQGDAYIGNNFDELAPEEEFVEDNYSDEEDYGGEDNAPLSEADLNALPPDVQKLLRPSPIKLVVLFDKIIDLQIPRHVAIIIYSLNKNNRFVRFFELVIKKDDGKILLDENGKPINQTQTDPFNIIDFFNGRGEAEFRKNSDIYEMPITDEQYNALTAKAEAITAKNNGTIHGREANEYNCVTYIADLLRAMNFEVPEGFGRTIIDSRNNKGAAVPPFKDWILQNAEWQSIKDLVEFFADLSKIARGR